MWLLNLTAAANLISQKSNNVLLDKGYITNESSMCSGNTVYMFNTLSLNIASKVHGHSDLELREVYPLL